MASLLPTESSGVEVHRGIEAIIYNGVVVPEINYGEESDLDQG